MSMSSPSALRLAQFDLPIHPTAAVSNARSVWESLLGGGFEDIKGNFDSESAAVMAVARHFHFATRENNWEIGALILKKDGKYSLGFSQQGDARSVEVSFAEVKRYIAQGFELVSHVHSHPDKVLLADGWNPVLQGPTFYDLQGWLALGIQRGYVVAGDGAVIRTTLPREGWTGTVGEVQLDVIGDVEPQYNSGRPLNLWHRDEDGPNPMLDPSQIKDLTAN